MESVAAIIEAFGGPAKFGSAIGISANHAGVMKARDRIGPEYWERLVCEARARGLADVTLEALARLAARKRSLVEPHSASPVS